jgi:hypothetical protein
MQRRSPVVVLRSGMDGLLAALLGIVEARVGVVAP